MFKINKAQITTMFVTVAALGRACGTTAAAAGASGRWSTGKFQRYPLGRECWLARATPRMRGLALSQDAQMNHGGPAPAGECPR